MADALFTMLEQEHVARRPWLVAPSDSIWEISAEHPGGKHSWQQCLAVRVPDFATGGGVLFKTFGALEDMIAPEWITSARELLLVEAADPREAYYERDQAFLAAALAASTPTEPEEAS